MLSVLPLCCPLMISFLQGVYIETTTCLWGLIPSRIISNMEVLEAVRIIQEGNESLIANTAVFKGKCEGSAFIDLVHAKDVPVFQIVAPDASSLAPALSRDAHASESAPYSGLSPPSNPTIDLTIDDNHDEHDIPKPIPVCQPFINVLGGFTDIDVCLCFYYYYYYFL